MLGFPKLSQEEASDEILHETASRLLGIDLHARTMVVCILNHDGAMVFHRNLPSTPAAFLRAIAAYREDLVVAVECMFARYWLADLCAQEGIAFVLGHALYMKAIHGGKAKNDRIDAHTIAGLLRGGMLPMAYVSPAEMRATRDLLRRRCHLMHKRAELLAHIQNTTSQSCLPPFGKKIAYTTNRRGRGYRDHEYLLLKVQRATAERRRLRKTA